MITHKKSTLTLESGEIVEAQSPIIISASRATDIPAFYTDWFFNRLDKGYLDWRNPFNGSTLHISFENTRFIVFWSKNPLPLIPHLNKLKAKNIDFYIHYTLNDYEKEKYEPNLPKLQQRIDSFKHLADTAGSERLIWRFDPLMLTDKISIESLLERIQNIGNQLKGYSQKLVFSFAILSR